MTDKLPISVNSMDDDSLSEFVESPNTFLKDVPKEVIPSPFSLQTKSRIEDLLKEKGISEEDFARRIDIYAMVKVKNIEVID